MASLKVQLNRKQGSSLLSVLIKAQLEVVIWLRDQWWYKTATETLFLCPRIPSASKIYNSLAYILLCYSKQEH